MEEAHKYDSFFDSSQPQSHHTLWSFEENKIFEDSLAELNPSCPNFFENLSSKVPFKTVEQVKSHYRALIDDIEMIEAGIIDPPEYNDGTQGDLKSTKNGQGSSSNQETKTASQNDSKGVPWSEEEHKLFLMGLEKYGKGDWKSISRYYVLTRTPIQVASHAQKYFRRLQTSVPVERHRPSIHDTINRTTITASTPQHESKILEQAEKPLPPPNAIPSNNMISFYNNQQESHPYFNQHVSVYPSPLTTTSTSALSMTQMTTMTQSSNASSSSSSFASPKNWFWCT